MGSFTTGTPGEHRQHTMCGTHTVLFWARRWWYLRLYQPLTRVGVLHLL